MIKYLAFAAVAGVTLASGAAQATSPWPSNVVGSWSANANQNALTIKIASQASSGECRQIAGTISAPSQGTPDNLLGIYCPTSGHIAFTRTIAGAATAFQNYTANLSQKVKTSYMGGVFAENATPANVGEYGFYAIKGK
jgi:hypothetical protein